MSDPLGDIFEARSCGAPFSGMNLGTNSSKSASATHPRRRFRTPHRACTHWHRNCPFNGTGSLTKEGVVTCHSQCDGLDKLWEKKKNKLWEASGTANTRLPVLRHKFNQKNTETQYE